MSAEEIEEAARLLRLRLGFNVKVARLELGLTQEELGTQTGKGRVYTQRIESGASNVTLETLVSLALALLKTVPDLLQEPAAKAGKSHSGNAAGSQYAFQPGDLSIVLPAGQAFEAGQLLAGHLGRDIPLVDPDTRAVGGIVYSATRE